MTTNIGPFNVSDVIAGKYLVRGLLGKGGHAFVYDCLHTALEEEVAVKVIPPAPHRSAKAFTHKEARALRRMNHANLVAVHDAGDFNGMPYIVMEKLQGMDLRKRMQLVGPLTVFEALTIASQVAKALEAAHAIGVIHRDLKPENVFLCANNQVKVLDFGIAKVLAGVDPTTQKDLIQGTIAYMSPEQMQGHGVTFASDVFQLFVLLYEMITGVCPCMVGVEEPTTEALIAIQISKYPPRLKALVPEVPDYLDRLVWRALAKEPAQRFPAMDASREKLKAVHSGVMTEFLVAIDNVIERLKLELPAEQLVIRTAPTGPRRDLPRRSGVPAAPAPQPDPRTTPIALASSNGDASVRIVGPMGTEVIPRPGARRAPNASSVSPHPTRPNLRIIESPTTALRAIRMQLSRAAAIGAVVGLPLALGLWFLSHAYSNSRAIEASAHSAAPAAVPRSAAGLPKSESVTQTPPAAPPSPAGIVLPAPTTPSRPESSPQASASLTTAVPATSQAPTAPKAAPKSSSGHVVTRAIPTRDPDWLGPEPEPKPPMRTAAKPTQPKPASSTTTPKVKLIF